jgi:PPP family 3-phenylpropionic acid transporter
VTDSGQLERDHVWRRAAYRSAGGYFWYFAAVGALWPFAPIYYRDLGLDGAQLGVLTALPPLAMALLGPVFGAIADARGVHRLMLCVAMTVAALAALAVSQVTAFWSLVLLVGVLAVAAVPIPALLDSYALVVGERTGIPYGRLRVAGSLGYMAISLLVGLAIGGEASTIFLFVYAACLALALAMVIGFPAISERQPRPLFGSLGILRGNRRLQLLLATAFMISIGSATIGTFLGLRIEDLGGSSGLVGGAFAISALAELPVVAFGGWFLARLGPVRMIAFAMLSYVIRFGVNAAIETPELLLLTQLLHGISYGAFLIASVTLAYRIGGREEAATAQALLTGMAFGLGAITGSLAGGALLDRIGTEGIFIVAAVVMAVTLVLFLLANRSVRLQDAGT